MLMKKSDLANAAVETAKIAEEGLSAAQKHLLDTVELIRTEGENLIAAEKRHLEKLRKVQVNAKNAEIRKEWAKQKEKQLRALLKSEQTVQEQVLRMQRAVVDVEINDDSSTSAQSQSQNKHLKDAQQRIEQLGDEILREQRARFKELREEALDLDVLRERDKSSSKQKSSSSFSKTKSQGFKQAFASIEEGLDKETSSSSDNSSNHDDNSSNSIDNMQGLDVSSDSSSNIVSSLDSPVSRSRKTKTNPNNLSMIPRVGRKEESESSIDSYGLGKDFLVDLNSSESSHENKNKSRTFESSKQKVSKSMVSSSNVSETRKVMKEFSRERSSESTSDLTEEKPISISPSSNSKAASTFFETVTITSQTDQPITSNRSASRRESVREDLEDLADKSLK